MQYHYQHCTSTIISNDEYINTQACSTQIMYYYVMRPTCALQNSGCSQYNLSAPVDLLCCAWTSFVPMCCCYLPIAASTEEPGSSLNPIWCCICQTWCVCIDAAASNISNLLCDALCDALCDVCDALCDVASDVCDVVFDIVTFRYESTTCIIWSCG